MRKLFFTAILATGAALSGCTEPSFLPLTSVMETTGTRVDVDLSQEINNFKRSPSTGNGFAYVSGADVKGSKQRSVLAVGLLPGTSVSAPPSTGSAVYRAAFEYQRLISTDDFTTASRSKFSGNMTLNADFSKSTLSGSVTGSAGRFAVNGKFKGTALSGNVVVQNPSRPTVTATLSGLMGAQQSVGIFHGSAGDTAIAGGFIADRQ